MGYRGIVLPMYNFNVCMEYNLCTTLRMYYINIIIRENRREIKGMYARCLCCSISIFRHLYGRR